MSKTTTLPITLSVKIPAYWLDDAVDSLIEYINDEVCNSTEDGDDIVNLDEALKSEAVTTLIIDALSRRIEAEADIGNFYASDVVGDDDQLRKAVNKILAPQFKMIKKYHDDQKKVREQKLAAAAARLEEIKKQGVPVRIAQADYDKAAAILRAAGIEVTEA